MGEPLRWEARAEREGRAREELEGLLETLREAGVLRLLNALAARGPEALELLVERLDAPAGRNGLGNLAVLARALGELEPAALDRFLEASRRGLAEAGERVRADPPGALALLGRSNDEDVRRGLWAVLSFLGALGRALREDGGDGA